MSQKKLAIAFIGVDIMHWIHGDSAIPLSREIRKIQAEGRVFVVGDKLSNADDDVRELDRLSWFRCSTDQSTINWIVVRNGEAAPWAGANFIAEATALFINNNSNLFTYRQFFDMSTQTSNAKASALYECIVNHNQQPQKEITMPTKPTMTNAGLHNLLVAARKLISAEQNTKEQQSIFSPEHIAKELHNLRDHPKYAPSAMSDPQISSLVDDLIPAFSTEVELNKEESNGFILRLDMVIDKLRTRGANNVEFWPKAEDESKETPNEPIDFEELLAGISDAAALLSGPTVSADPVVTVARLKKAEAYLRQQRDTPFGMAVSDNPPASGAEAMLRQLSADFVEGHEILEKSIKKLGEHFSEASGVMARAIDKLMDNVHQRLQNTEDKLSNEMKAGLRHMLGMLNQRPSVGQPYGPLQQSPLDSFPKMPDNFGYPNPFYNPEYPRGPVDPLARMRYVNEYCTPRRHKAQTFGNGVNNGFGAAGPGVPVYTPEAFNGIFLFHVENDMAYEPINSARDLITSLYPWAKIEIANYENADTSDGLREVCKQKMTEIANRYIAQSIPVQHLIVSPSIRKDVEKVLAIKNMVGFVGAHFAELPVTSLVSRSALHAVLNTAVKNLLARNSNGSGELPSEFEGAFVIHVDDFQTDQKVIALEGLFRQAFPQAGFVVLRYSEHPNMPIGQAISLAEANATIRFNTKDVFHLVPVPLYPASSLEPSEISSELSHQKRPYREITLEGIYDPETFRHAIMTDRSFTSRHSK